MRIKKLINCNPIILFTVLFSCNGNKENTNPARPEKDYAKGTYGYDAAFLKKNLSNVIELQDESGSSKLLLTADYQGRERLLNVNIWHKLAGALSATFHVLDPFGKPASRLVIKGDFIRIDLPGPGDRSDYVTVEEIIDNSNPDAENELISMRVRPAANPEDKSNSDVKHFFGDEATSTFTVTRKGLTVSASVQGRNEKPNTDTSESKDNLRNAAIAAGAMAGFSKIQWKLLTDGLLDDEVNGLEPNHQDKKD